jgi:hypothetical protein
LGRNAYFATTASSADTEARSAGGPQQLQGGLSDKMRSGLAVKILLSIISLIILFHMSILLKVVPREYVWGGRLGSDRELYLFETFSLLVNFYLLFILLIRGGYIKPFLSAKVVNVSLWIFLILFMLNTVGNVFAKTAFEQLFALLTLAISVLLWIVLSKKGSRERS